MTTQSSQPSGGEMQYRKKPVVINAMRLPDVMDIDGRVAFDDWICAVQGERKSRYAGDKLHIQTLEGVMVADVGDWVIRGVKGEIYPCKPDIFEQTYELASTPPVEQMGREKKEPVPVHIWCPKCLTQHIDEGEWATKPHRTHQCQNCKHEWRPYEFHSVGAHLPPGYKLVPIEPNQSQLLLLGLLSAAGAQTREQYIEAYKGLLLAALNPTGDKR